MGFEFAVRVLRARLRVSQMLTGSSNSTLCCGFPKVRGTFLGVPISNEDYSLMVFLVYIWVPLFWESHGQVTSTLVPLNPTP